MYFFMEMCHKYCWRSWYFVDYLENMKIFIFSSCRTYSVGVNRTVWNKGGRVLNRISLAAFSPRYHNNSCNIFYPSYFIICVSQYNSLFLTNGGNLVLQTWYSSWMVGNYATTIFHFTPQNFLFQFPVRVCQLLWVIFW